MDAPVNPGVDSSADAGCFWQTCAAPPAGFALCGSGTVDVAAAAAACNSVNPPMDLGEGLSKTCSAFTLIQGNYEVYCSATQVYFWVDYTKASSSSVLDCMFSVPVDGGMVMGSFGALGWDAQINARILATVTGAGGTSDIGMLESEKSVATGPQPVNGMWDGSLVLSGLTGKLGVSGAHVGATLYLTATPVDCNDVPTGQDSLVAAAPISWVVP